MFQKISSNFFPSIDLSYLDSMPLIAYKKNAEKGIDPAWYVYNLQYGGIKTPILFFEHLNKINPIFCEEVVEKIATISNNQVLKAPQDVRIIKTTGNVVPHRDGIRQSCINIGLGNQTATTSVSKNNIFDDFMLTPPEVVSFTINPGDIYIMDTKNVHSVTQMQNVNRYLITISFRIPYSRLLSNFQS